MELKKFNFSATAAAADYAAAIALRFEAVREAGLELVSSAPAVAAPAFKFG